MKKIAYRWRQYDDKFRLGLILTLLFLLATLLAIRFFILSIYNRPFLLVQGNARTVRTIDISAHRGMILDRNHYPLAISTTVYSVWVDPRVFSLLDPHLPELANCLNLSVGEIEAHLNSAGHKDFIYLKRLLPPTVATQIKNLNIVGVHLQQGYHRFYPNGEEDATLLGLTNIDDKGQEGIELSYNSMLEGIPGKERVVQDLYGHVVEVQGLIKPAKPGKNLVLSVDHRLQYLAYTAVNNMVMKTQAEMGAMVILDVQTGEILAMVSAPSFNPNIPRRSAHLVYKNHAVTDQFEPGSTMKTFAVANALNSGKYHPNSIVDTNPGWMILNGHRVQDEHNLGVIDVTTILQRSSNMGISKLTLSLPPNSLWNLLHSIGFGQPTGLIFPGEASGSLIEPRKWSDIALATLSFGYGVSASLTQLAQGYAMIGNDGIKMPLSLEKLSSPPKGMMILKPVVAQALVTMLEAVIQKGGTATSAGVSHYLVAGKTGTAWILGPHGYQKNAVNALFIGMIPASHPRLVGAVLIKNPQVTHHQGGDVSAPIFSQVMTMAVRLLNIPPDNLTTAQTINKPVGNQSNFKGVGQ